MRAEVKRIRDVVANKDLVPMLVHFVYNNGYLYASDGDHTAATPLDLGDVPRFFVLASELHAFLDKIDGKPQVSVGEDGAVSVTCGKMRARFAGLTPGITAFDVQPEPGKRCDIPKHFMDRLAEVRPFVSENANKPFATCVLCRSGHLYATSNIAIVSAEMSLPGFFYEDILLPAKVADYVLSRPEPPTHFDVSERSIIFYWEDGTWYNTSRFSHTFPAIEATLKSVEEATWRVPKYWREAVQHVIRLGEEQLEIYPDKIIGKTKQGTMYEATVETDLPENIPCLSVEPEFLGPVFEAAMQMKVYKQGSRALISFVTGTLSGVGVGRVK